MYLSLLFLERQLRCICQNCIAKRILCGKFFMHQWNLQFFNKIFDCRKRQYFLSFKICPLNVCKLICNYFQILSHLISLSKMGPCFIFLHLSITSYAKSRFYRLDWKLTPSQDVGHCNVTGTCFTVPRPKASRFLCAENSLSSFFSSSLKLLQYLVFVKSNIQYLGNVWNHYNLFTPSLYVKNDLTWLHCRGEVVDAKAVLFDVFLQLNWHRVLYLPVM